MEKVELRDQFAMAAVQGLLAGDCDSESIIYWSDGKLQADMAAEHAYKIADAMMEARNSR